MTRLVNVKADPRLWYIFLKIFKNCFSRREIFFMGKNEKKNWNFFSKWNLQNSLFDRHVLKQPRYYIKIDIYIGSNCIQDRMKKICEKIKWTCDTLKFKIASISSNLKPPCSTSLYSHFYFLLIFVIVYR